MGRGLSAGMFVTVLVFALFPVTSSTAETLVVPDGYDTIQSAIDEAEDGDVVEVSEGTYFERIDFLGKAISLIAIDGPDLTTIHGEREGTVVTFDNEEQNDSVLDGFTITGGLEIRGAGIFATSSPTITNCILVGNRAFNEPPPPGDDPCSFIYGASGGGFWFGNESASNALVMKDCIIYENVAESCNALGGGGYVLSETALTFEDNLVCDNEVIAYDSTITPAGGGLYVLSGCYRGNVIVDNISGSDGDGVSHGGGVYAGNEGTALVNNTIYGNLAESDGGGVVGSGSVVIRNCIIRDNSADEDPQVSLSSAVEMTYCNVEDLSDDYEGDGNFDDDPLFAGELDGDFTLLESSPCIDAGDPESPLDLDGTVADVGAFFYSQPRPFLRGDCDGSGVVSVLLDALYLLEWAFEEGELPPCLDAADVDDNGTVSALLDSLALMRWGFDDGDVPPSPGPDECDADPTDDSVYCVTVADECE